MRIANTAETAERVCTRQYSLRLASCYQPLLFNEFADVSPEIRAIDVTLRWRLRWGTRLARSGSVRLTP